MFYNLSVQASSHSSDDNDDDLTDVPAPSSLNMAYGGGRGDNLFVRDYPLQ